MSTARSHPSGIMYIYRKTAPKFLLFDHARLNKTTVLILEILKCGGSSPLCPKNVGAWSIKMGTCTSAKEGLISEAFVCPYVC